jgi:ATP-dependent Clp protease ATP-binding subunit ClpA
MDMSEFNESHSISKIIGAPPGYIGYSDNKNILEEIRDKPNAVLILDEIERCNKTILNLFMQILDEGYTKDSKGKVIYFDNVTIIMTSNIGFNKNSLGFNNNKNGVTIKLKDTLGVEFINRISKIIEFNTITKETVLSIINKKIEKLEEKYNISIKINDNVKNDILESSQYELFGARRIEGLIKNNIENVIVDDSLNGSKNIVINDMKEKITI